MSGTPSDKASETIPLAQSVKFIDNYYAQLKPALLALRKKYPETVRMTQDMDRADGFSRILDLVPNMQQYMSVAITRPDMKSPTPLASYSPRISEIFTQSRQLLDKMKNDPIVQDTGALGLNDLLEDYLHEACKGFDARTPSPQGVTAVRNERLAAPPAAGIVPGVK